MIASGVGFSVMAVGIKLLGHRLENFQIGFFRVVIGFLAILPFVAGGGLARLRTRHAGVHFVRAIFGLTAMYCGYYAIARMPLGDYTGLTFTKPLFATVLAIVSPARSTSPTARRSCGDSASLAASDPSSPSLSFPRKRESRTTGLIVCPGPPLSRG